jgi:hypothetical protein
VSGLTWLKATKKFQWLDLTRLAQPVKAENRSESHKIMSGNLNIEIQAQSSKIHRVAVLSSESLIVNKYISYNIHVQSSYVSS